jgi:hypothetical protein
VEASKSASEIPAETQRQIEFATMGPSLMEKAQADLLALEEAAINADYFASCEASWGDNSRKTGGCKVKRGRGSDIRSSQMYIARPAKGLA